MKTYSRESLQSLLDSFLIVVGATRGLTAVDQTSDHGLVGNIEVENGSGWGKLRKIGEVGVQHYSVYSNYTLSIIIEKFLRGLLYTQYCISFDQTTQLEQSSIHSSLIPLKEMKNLRCFRIAHPERLHVGSHRSRIPWHRHWPSFCP